MTPTSDRLLLEQYRWLRSAWPLAIAAAGLAVTLAIGWWVHPAWARIEKWGALPAWWAGGLGLTLLASIGVWLLRRRSLLQSAQRLDARLAAKSRVETATMLREASDPLARAQREETAEFLEHAPARARRTPLWILIGMVVLLALAHVVTLVSWTRPWMRPAIAATGEKPAPPPAAPTATIKWKTPKSEIKAAPIEEVPLEAAAGSSSGLRDLALEVAVNGEPKLTVPVPLEGLDKPGAHPILASLYLDQLEVEPYDMVSYYLRARRIGDQRDLPETASPMQFVQVKPFRDDIREMPAGGGMPGGEEALDQTRSLKAAQLRLMKENFMLLHAEIPREHPDWQKENARVGADQGVLETKATEMIEKMIALGAPAEIVNLISQARPLMGEASQKIVAVLNEQARPPQGKALGLITEVEKYFIKVTSRGEPQSGQPRPQVSDPFEKQRDVELKQRFETEAGELELLAQEQTRLAEDLARNAPAMPAPETEPKKNRITGSAPERQTQVSQRVGALLNGNVLGPETTGHLENARDEARDSLRHLDAEDPVAAGEPAAAAARELRLAKEAMERAGEEQAQEQMEAALRDLSQAAETARTAPDQGSESAAREAAQKAAERAEQTRRELAEQAQKQQQTGSEKAAQRMADLANGLNDSKLREALEKLRDTPRDRAQADTAARRLDELAQRAAQQAPGAETPSPERLADLIERMDRARANLERLAQLSKETPAGASREDAARQGEEQGRQPGSQPESDRQSQEGQGQGEERAETPGAGRQQGETAQQPGGGQRQDQRQRDQGQGETPGQDQQMAGAPGAGRHQSESNQQPGGGQRGEQGQAQAQGQGEMQGQRSGQRPGADGGGTGGIAPGAGRGSDRDRFARDVLEELRELTDTGNRYLPNSPLVYEARAVVHEGLRTMRHGEQRGRLWGLWTQLDEPLGGVIDLLRAELQRSMRQHQLTNQSADQAPPAYRAAVADYFERLSRDYDRGEMARDE